MFHSRKFRTMKTWQVTFERTHGGALKNILKNSNDSPVVAMTKMKRHVKRQIINEELEKCVCACVCPRYKFIYAHKFCNFGWFWWNMMTWECCVLCRDMNACTERKVCVICVQNDVRKKKLRLEEEASTILVYMFGVSYTPPIRHLSPQYGHKLKIKLRSP